MGIALATLAESIPQFALLLVLTLLPMRLVFGPATPRESMPVWLQAQAAIGRDRLEVSAEVLSRDEPFASLPPERRTALIQEQSIIVEFEPELAVKTLPDLLPKSEDRKRAVELVRFIAGRVAEMEPKTIQALETFHRILRLPPMALTAPTKDPLKTSTAAAPDDLVQAVTDATAPAAEAPKSEAAFGAAKPKKAKTKEPA